jgi:hypothetical protein
MFIRRSTLNRRPQGWAPQRSASFIVLPKSSSALHPRRPLDDPSPWSPAFPAILATVTINNHLHLSLLHLKQNLLHQPLPPVIPLREEEYVSGDARVLTT